MSFKFTPCCGCGCIPFNTSFIYYSSGTGLASYSKCYPFYIYGGIGVIQSDSGVLIPTSYISGIFEYNSIININDGMYNYQYDYIMETGNTTENCSILIPPILYPYELYWTTHGAGILSNSGFMPSEMPSGWNINQLPINSPPNTGIKFFLKRRGTPNWNYSDILENTTSGCILTNPPLTNIHLDMSTVGYNDYISNGILTPINNPVNWTPGHLIDCELSFESGDDNWQNYNILDNTATSLTIDTGINTYSYIYNNIRYGYVRWQLRFPSYIIGNGIDWYGMLSGNILTYKDGLDPHEFYDYYTWFKSGNMVGEKVSVNGNWHTTIANDNDSITFDSVFSEDYTYDFELRDNIYYSNISTTGLIGICSGEWTSFTTNYYGHYPSYQFYNNSGNTIKIGTKNYTIENNTFGKINTIEPSPSYIYNIIDYHSMDAKTIQSGLWGVRKIIPTGSCLQFGSGLSTITGYGLLTFDNAKAGAINGINYSAYTDIYTTGCHQLVGLWDYYTHQQIATGFPNLSSEGTKYRLHFGTSGQYYVQATLSYYDNMNSGNPATSSSFFSAPASPSSWYKECNIIYDIYGPNGKLNNYSTSGTATSIFNPYYNILSLNVNVYELSDGIHIESINDISYLDYINKLYPYYTYHFKDMESSTQNQGELHIVIPKESWNYTDHQIGLGGLPGISGFPEFRDIGVGCIAPCTNPSGQTVPCCLISTIRGAKLTDDVVPGEGVAYCHYGDIVLYTPAYSSCKGWIGNNSCENLVTYITLQSGINNWQIMVSGNNGEVIFKKDYGEIKPDLSTFNKENIPIYNYGTKYRSDSTCKLSYIDDPIYCCVPRTGLCGCDLSLKSEEDSNITKNANCCLYGIWNNIKETGLCGYGPRDIESINSQPIYFSSKGLSGCYYNAGVNEPSPTCCQWSSNINSGYDILDGYTLKLIKNTVGEYIFITSNPTFTTTTTTDSQREGLQTTGTTYARFEANLGLTPPNLNNLNGVELSYVNGNYPFSKNADYSYSTLKIYTSDKNYTGCTNLCPTTKYNLNDVQSWDVHFSNMSGTNFSAIPMNNCYPIEWSGKHPCNVGTPLFFYNNDWIQGQTWNFTKVANNMWQYITQWPSAVITNCVPITGPWITTGLFGHYEYVNVTGYLVALNIFNPNDNPNCIMMSGFNIPGLPYPLNKGIGCPVTVGGYGMCNWWTLSPFIRRIGCNRDPSTISNFRMGYQSFFTSFGSVYFLNNIIEINSPNECVTLTAN